MAERGIIDEQTKSPRQCTAAETQSSVAEENVFNYTDAMLEAAIGQAGAAERERLTGEKIYLSDEVIPALWQEIEQLRSCLRGATDYLEQLDKAHPDLVLSIHGLRPIKDMLPIWRGERDWPVDAKTGKAITDLE